MKILSLNGGGTLAYISVSILEKLEKETGKPAYEMFDLIAGVSAGSLVGSAIALGHTAAEVKELFKDLAKKVFVDPRWFFMRLFKSQYEIENLEKVVKETLVDKKMGDCKTKFMTYATEINTGILKTKFWKSWKEEEKDTPIYAPLCASSCSPSYFDPYVFNNIGYIDGAFGQNNPTISAICSALTFGKELSDIKCLNLSPFKGYGVKDVDDFKGLINIIKRVVEFIINGTDDANVYQAKKLLGMNYLMVEPDFTTNADTLDFDKLDKVADKLWSGYNLGIINLVK